MTSARRLATVSCRTFGAIALTVLAACGGSDDPPAAAADTVSTEAAEAAPSDTAAPSGTAGSDAPAATNAPASGGLGMGAETWAKQLKVALRADDYTIDGNTVTVILGDGTTADGDSDCGVAGATAGTNVTVIVSYPDGDVAC